MSEWPALKSALAERIEPAGFEVLGAANVGAYNRTLDGKLEDYRLPEPGGEGSLLLVLGNTRRLWPLFLDALRAAPLRDELHPLDTYSRTLLGPAVASTAQAFGVTYALRFSFDPPPRAVAIQRAASVAGVAEASPVGLSVHPVHGPWFSLRAVAVLGLDGPAAQTPASTCSACRGQPCQAALAKVRDATGGVYTRESFMAHWRLWLGMRDACPVGRDGRYSDQQIRYHYLKERAVLHEPRE